jgi:hypothetical protein
VHVNAASIAVLLAAACADPPLDPDLRTPIATAKTLLRAYHLDRATEAQIQRRVRRGIVSSSEHPIDVALEKKALADFDPDDPAHRSLAVFLVGAIAARRERLQESMAGDRGTVYVGDELMVVLRRDPVGWKILMEESVPAAVRESLRGR